MPNLSQARPSAHSVSLLAQRRRVFLKSLLHLALSLCLVLLRKLFLRLKDFSFASFSRFFTPSSCFPAFFTAASTRDCVRSFAWREQS
eukprot:6174252-Pleurochrysis_carterae.AAC.1